RESQCRGTCAIAMQNESGAGDLGRPNARKGMARGPSPFEFRGRQDQLRTPTSGNYSAAGSSSASAGSSAGISSAGDSSMDSSSAGSAAGAVSGVASPGFAVSEFFLSQAAREPATASMSRVLVIFIVAAFLVG